MSLEGTLIPGKTAVLIMLRTLLRECIKHNNDYHHKTPETILVDTGKVIQYMEQL